MVYLLMAALGLTGVVLAARQGRRLAQSAATFVVAALGVMLADWVAFGWLGLYAYRPHLAVDPQLDGSLGELLADIIFVPALATLVTARLPKLYAAVLGTFAVTAVEFLFMRSGLLIHHGWETWQSAALFPFYFLLVGKLWQRLDHLARLEGNVHLLVRISLLFVLTGIYTLGLRPFNVVLTNVHVFPQRIQNQSLGRFLTYPPAVLPAGCWVMAGPRRQRRWRLAAALAFFGVVNLVLIATGVQVFKAPYTWYLDAVGQTAAIWVACMCDDLIVHHWSAAKARAV